MDTKTIRYLHELNNRFYQEQGASFARTRGAPWHGWKHCLEVLQAEEDVQNRNTLSVIDVASGNARFKNFLQESLPSTEIDYFAVDNSCEMAAGSEFQNLDVLELLIDGQELSEQIPVPACDLSSSFGFMHHIPSQELRKSLLENMLDVTKPSGFIIVSFWQFLKSAELAHKAETTHAQALEQLGSNIPYECAASLQAALDAGDYFLGWQDKLGVYRYCHNFSEEEIDELVASLADKAELVSRFSADGRTQNLNTYIILQKLAR